MTGKEREAASEIVLCMWLTDDEKRAELSRAAGTMGTPNAARDIAKAIGDSALRWIELNDEKPEEFSPSSS